VDNEFDVGVEVSTLGISLFLFGIGLGLLIWALISEVYGQKAIVFALYFIAMVFLFATAISKDIQTIMITRFFTGFFGSAPITNVGGVLSDIWTTKHRGAAVVVYALTLVAGTVLGPIVGGAIAASDLDWR
jgi:MFS family permease